MTTAWLIAAVILVSFLLGVLSASLVFQYMRNARLEGRIKSLGAQLRNVPKRKIDRLAE